jgi:RNA polymerase subunit RPABC4/transcription elongation factor Spt4
VVKVGALLADDIVVTDQTDVRCPQCGALVRAGSQWCTLCFADLRPAPAPVAAAVLEPSYAAVAAGSSGRIDHPTAPLSALEAAAPADGIELPADPDAKAVGWPCTSCGEVVSFDETQCPTCGTAFLAGAAGEPDFLQRIGRTGLPTSTQAMIIAGGIFGIIAVVIAAMYIFGTIF